MKKLALTIVCAMAVSGAAFAQGYIQWNLATTGVTFQTNAVSYSPLFGGGAYAGGTIGNTATAAGGFDYILLTSAFTGQASTDLNVWDGTWSALTAFGGGALTATNATSGPTAPGKAIAVNGGVANQVSWANGTTQNVVVVGWSTTLGTSWVGVSNLLANLAAGNSAPLAAQLNGALGFFGETAIGFINPNSASPGAALVAGAAQQSYGNAIFSLNTQLYLLPVPEPATMALAGLGGLSLLLFRRRRQ